MDDGVKILKSRTQDGSVKLYEQARLMRLDVGGMIRSATNMRQKLLSRLGATLAVDRSFQTESETFINDADDEHYTTGTVQGCEPQERLTVDLKASSAILSHLRSLGLESATVTGMGCVYDILMTCREKLEAPLIYTARSIISEACTDWVMNESPDMEIDAPELQLRITQCCKAVETGLKYPSMQVEAWALIMNRDASDLPLYQERGEQSHRSQGPVMNLTGEQKHGHTHAVRRYQHHAQRTLKRRRTGDIPALQGAAANQGHNMDVDAVLTSAEQATTEHIGLARNHPNFSTVCGARAQRALNQVWTRNTRLQQRQIAHTVTAMRLPDPQDQVGHRLPVQYGAEPRRGDNEAYDQFIANFQGPAQEREQQRGGGPEDLSSEEEDALLNQQLFGAVDAQAEESESMDEDDIEF